MSGYGLAFGAITPWLALGSGTHDPEDVARLAREGFTDALDVRAEYDATPLFEGSRLRLTRLPMIDDGRRQPAEVYQQAYDVIEAARQHGGKVYLSCEAGQYRSPSVAYYVLRRYGLSPDDAWARVLQARPSANRQYVGSADAALGVPVPVPNRRGRAVLVALAALGSYLVWRHTRGPVRHRGGRA